MENNYFSAGMNHVYHYSSSDHHLDGAADRIMINDEAIELSTDVKKDLSSLHKKMVLSTVEMKQIRGNRKKRIALRIAITTLALVTAPLLLLIGGGIAITKVFNPEKNSWNRVMRKALLPIAGQRLTLTKPAEDHHVRHIKIKVSEDVLLDGVLRIPKGVSTEQAKKLPIVTLFCQNAGCIESDHMQRQAEEYQRRGFHVLMCNYRGVGESTGQLKRGEDLMADGIATIRALIQGELLDGEHRPLELRWAAKDIILDGSSLGGAVAIHAGAAFPETTLVANRTFTRWSAAAEGVSSKCTNPIVAKLTGALLQRSNKAKIDNVQSLRERMVLSHSLTIIESAGLTGDGVLTRSSKLNGRVIDEELLPDIKDSCRISLFTEDILHQCDHSDEMPSFHDHHSFMPLTERTLLMEGVIKPNEIKYTTMKIANSLISLALQLDLDEESIQSKIALLQPALRFLHTKGRDRPLVLTHLKQWLDREYFQALLQTLAISEGTDETRMEQLRLLHMIHVDEHHEETRRSFISSLFASIIDSLPDDELHEDRVRRLTICEDLFASLFFPRHPSENS